MLLSVLLLTTAPVPPLQQGTPAAPAEQPHAATDVAAYYGGTASCTFAELDALLVTRHWKGPIGREVLKEQLERAVVVAAMEEAELEISQRMLNQRWKSLDQELRDQGREEGLASLLEEQGVDLGTFREYLELFVGQEILTRRTLGLAEDAAVTAEQQQLWLEKKLEAWGVESGSPPFAEGWITRCGPVFTDEGVVHRVSLPVDEYGVALREALLEADETQVKKACYELLLAQAVRGRMPDLTQEGIERALDAELERKRARAEANPVYQGQSYENLLAAQGLSIPVLRADPAILCAALSHAWVDRVSGDEGLRGTYEADREYFDALYGEGVEVYVIFRRAVNEGVTLPVEPDAGPGIRVPGFDEADRELRELETTLEQVRADVLARRPSAEREAAGAVLDRFQELAPALSDHKESAEKSGEYAVVRRGTPGMSREIVHVVFEALEAAEAAAPASDGTATPPPPVVGTLLGPLRLEGGVALLCLGDRVPAPTWEVMSSHVHAELRRRFFEQSMPRIGMVTWLDE